MATNFVRGMETVNVAAPFAVVSGRVVIVGVNLFGVAMSNAAIGEQVALVRGGTFTFPKASAVSTSGVAGAVVYWDNTNSQVTISATSNTKIGVATIPFANTDTVVTVALNPASL
jgi:predicted RecA/RadA family phage recombinase